jgi:hypothetical protein
LEFIDCQLFLDRQTDKFEDFFLNDIAIFQGRFQIQIFKGNFFEPRVCYPIWTLRKLDTHRFLAIKEDKLN